MKIATLLLMAACSVAAPVYSQQSVVPEPPIIAGAPAVFTLPLPQGQSMEFSLIQVSAPVAIDEVNSFASYDYSIGSSLDANYMNRMAPTSVSGTVLIKTGDDDDVAWVLPVARTELTRAQYAALMCPDKMPQGDEAKMPQVNISELQVREFLAKLNHWCLTNADAKAALKQVRRGAYYGMPFVRMIQENEWEFAARGGFYVPRPRFESRHPYADDESLAKSEVLDFSGRSKVRAAASTGQANPCGLYDMLGNVSELVEGSFKPEFPCGRSGGLVTRGGYFLTSVTEASVYIRNELPCYFDGSGSEEAKLKAGQPATSANVGVRLAIGSSIVTAKLVGSKKLDDDWSDYISVRTTKRPGDSTTDTLDKKLQDEKGDIAMQLRAIADKMSALSGSGVQQKDLAKIEDYFKALNMQVSAIEAQANSSYRDTARAGLRMAYYSTANAGRDLVTMYDALLRAQVMTIPHMKDTLLNKSNVCRDNIPGYWDDVTLAVRSLKNIERKVFYEQVEARRKDILSSDNPLKKEQIFMFNCSVNVIERYLTTGKLDNEVRKYWEDQALAASAVPTAYVYLSDAVKFLKEEADCGSEPDADTREHIEMVYWLGYRNMLMALKNIGDPKFVTQQIELRRKHLAANGGKDKELQLKMFDCSVKFIEQFMKGGKLTDKTFDAWLKEVIAIANE